MLQKNAFSKFCCIFGKESFKKKTQNKMRAWPFFNPIYFNNLKIWVTGHWLISPYKIKLIIRETGFTTRRSCLMIINSHYLISI